MPLLRFMSASGDIFSHCPIRSVARERRESERGGDCPRNTRKDAKKGPGKIGRDSESDVVIFRLEDCKRPKFTNQSFFCPFFALFRVFRGRPSPFSFRLSRAIRRTGSKGWSPGLRRPE